MWTPGYWAGAGVAYYWVPGTWIHPPQVGVLWTRGYWGWGGVVAYLFHAGYWGPHIGFYGGVNYGFGYGGVGYEGGYWNNGQFAYNRSVNNISNVHVSEMTRSSSMMRTPISRRSRHPRSPSGMASILPRVGIRSRMDPAFRQSLSMHV